MRHAWRAQAGWLLAILLFPGSFAPAQPARPADTGPRYATVRASADGIGKSHAGREIARVMGWQGAAWLERPEREAEEGGERLLDELGLRPGMVVADVGAGSGWYTRRLARRIGADGVVHAVDVQPEMVALLRALPREPGAARIEPVQGEARDLGLPAASLDLVLMVDVYHELEYPYEMLASIVRALKPGGRVAFVEYRAEDPAVPIRALHKMTEQQVRREAGLHALVWERTSRRLPWQHLVVFRRP